MLDKLDNISNTIAVEGMCFYAYHGYYEEEQILGNEFIVDVYVNTNLIIARQTDDLKDTINYEMIYQITKAAMQTKAKLLEYVAEQIALGIKEISNNIRQITVRIKKKNPPIAIGGTTQSSYVEMIYQ